MKLNHLLSLFKALSDRNRLRIVAALMHCHELCACQIIELIQVTGSTISRHMQLLIDANLVSSRKEGRWVYYRLAVQDSDDKELVQWLEKTLKDHEDIQRDGELLNEISNCDLTQLSSRQREAGMASKS